MGYAQKQARKHQTKCYIARQHLTFGRPHDDTAHASKVAQVPSQGLQWVCEDCFDALNNNGR